MMVKKGGFYECLFASHFGVYSKKPLFTAHQLVIFIFIIIYYYFLFFIEKKITQKRKISCS